MSEKALRIIVQGVVQGVGFRYFVFSQATQMGLTGWTKNLPDGSVEVLACGNPGLLEQFVKELKIGPRHAHVSSVDTEQVAPEEQFGSFEIKGW